MRRPLSILALVAIFALLGCEDDNGTTGPSGDLEVATFKVVAGDLTTLTNAAVKVAAYTEDGILVRDLESMVLEYQAAGGAWTPLELSLEGSSNCFYTDGIGYQCIDGSMHTAWHTFTSSGTYSFRATGSHGDNSLSASATLDVERISRSVDGYDVGFESYPGDIRVGEAISFEFYVTGGLADAIVLCRESDGTSESHAAQDEGNGVYSAPHTFAQAGLASVTFQFTDSNGDPAEVTFDVNVLQ